MKEYQDHHMFERVHVTATIKNSMAFALCGGDPSFTFSVSREVALKMRDELDEELKRVGS